MVGHILVGWRGRSLVHAGFSLHPTPCDTDGPAGWRGGLFLEWASAVFRDGERAGAGSCRRITHHRSVDQYHLAQRPPCLCRDGKEEMNGEVLVIARPDRPPTGFADAHFLPATGLPIRAVQPPAWPAPLILLPILGARGGTGLQGLGSLDC